MMHPVDDVVLTASLDGYIRIWQLDNCELVGGDGRGRRGEVRGGGGKGEEVGSETRGRTGGRNGGRTGGRKGGWKGEWTE